MASNRRLSRKDDMTDELEWHRVCASDDVEEEDVLRFDHAGATYAIYHTPQGYYATDGMCTHEAAHLADGFVMGDVIECPKHQGRFHIPTGKARNAPVHVDLRTYPVRIEDGQVLLGLPKEA